ncbi:TIGR04219 family outer membrane beta-barrel protein [Sulfurimonas sp. MAG313]|nr:TIGR04219 family outer membrane beta-barrel protein [Sulfurimonas sp. MAG313]MDF1880414.1 TIGR04219 family outer membrane beta-barrel protein [Sulfurimonas sp. MAG313]
MNKFLSGLLLAGLLSISAQADFVRVEAGVGMWSQSIDGTIKYDNNPAFTTDTLGYGTVENPYAWIFIKHPIPILPNLRLEYAAVEFSGTSTQNFMFLNKPFPAGTTSSLTMDQIDAILYYNILDNTFWTTIDLGLDIKTMQGAFKADVTTPLGSIINVDESTNLVIPMAYGRLRVELPITDIGGELEVKYLEYSGSKVLDASIKVDYTLVDIIPFVDLGIEVGYRKQTIDLDSSDISSLNTSLKLDVDGAFIGIVGRF